MTGWTDFVKKYAKDNNITYKKAMSEAKDSYAKSKGKEGVAPKKAKVAKKTLTANEKGLINAKKMLSKTEKGTENYKVYEKLIKRYESKAPQAKQKTSEFKNVTDKLYANQAKKKARKEKKDDADFERIINKIRAEKAPAKVVKKILLKRPKAKAQAKAEPKAKVVKKILLKRPQATSKAVKKILEKDVPLLVEKVGKKKAVKITTFGPDKPPRKAKKEAEEEVSKKTKEMRNKRISMLNEQAKRVDKSIIPHIDKSSQDTIEKYFTKLVDIIDDDDFLKHLNDAKRKFTLFEKQIKEELKEKQTSKAVPKGKKEPAKAPAKQKTPKQLKTIEGLKKMLKNIPQGTEQYKLYEDMLNKLVKND